MTVGERGAFKMVWREGWRGGRGKRRGGSWRRERERERERGLGFRV